MSGDPTTPGVRPDMTDREVLALVRERMLAQDGPSRSPDRRPQGAPLCLYRGPGGRTCAAGALLADPEYRASLEGKASSDIDVWAALVRSGVPDRHSTRLMVRSCQAAHDGLAEGEWGLIGARLDAVAERLDGGGAWLAAPVGGHEDAGFLVP